MSRRLPETGFALPLVMLLMAILTLLLTAAFAQIQRDRWVADSSGAAVTALAMAQSGLQAYIGSGTARPPDGDSVRINVVGGYADVVASFAQRLDTLNPLYIVRSTGHLIVPTEGADPIASRTVAQFAQWQSAGALTTYPAVFNALNGIDNYSSGTVNIVAADSPSCIGPLVVQLAVPDDNYPTPPPGVTATGEPNDQWSSLIGVDWASIKGGSFTAASTTLTNLNSWSSYLITGDATLSLSGSGLLIVTDNLTISGSVTWAGVMLVGNQIIFTGTAGSVVTVSGLVVTGLDRLTAGTPPNGTLGGTGLTQTFKYDSCNIRHAMQFVTGFAPISNGWVDNWATY